VTAYFARRQWQTAREQAQTAREQAQTAREKVLLDLFDKRFAIYEELRACASCAREGDQIAVVSFKTAASRAQFLFGAEVTTFLEATRKDLAADVVQWKAPRPDAPQQLEAATDSLVARANQLDAFYSRLDALVAPYIRHHQKALDEPMVQL
jgi:hypothetical protein